MSRSPDDLHLLAGSYALDALDDEERARFERHLPGCDACRYDLEGFREATVVLAQAMAEPAPSSLRRRALDDMERTRQVPPLPLDAPRRWPRAFGVLVAAIALLIAAVSTGLLLDARRDIDRLEQQAAVAELVAALDLRSVALEGGPGVTRFTFAASQDRGVLVAEGWDPAPNEHTYQLWVISDGVAHPAGVFGPDASGRAELHVGQAPHAGDRLAVTIEPQGGSLTPTSPPVQVSDLL